MIFSKNGRRYFIDWYGCVVRIGAFDWVDWEAEWRAFEVWRQPPRGGSDDGR